MFNVSVGDLRNRTLKVYLGILFGRCRGGRRRDHLSSLACLRPAVAGINGSGFLPWGFVLGSAGAVRRGREACPAPYGAEKVAPRWIGAAFPGRAALGVL
jgi:hypothetical protein